MLILGIESATSRVGCAVGGHEGVIASAHSTKPRRHAESLAPQIDFVRKQARIELSELGVIAVDVGPGLFTGLRVGISTAMAMAYSLNVPMVGVSSLDLLAFSVRHTGRLLLAAVDARRGELFTAFYRPAPGGVQRITDPAVMKPDDVTAELAAAGEECLVVGDGGHRYSEVFGDLKRVELADRSFGAPSADALVELAHARAIREEFVQPSELRPMYLRKPDAEINWSTRQAEA